MGISKVKVCDEGSVQADVRKALIIIFSVLIILANCVLMLIISKTERLRKKVMKQRKYILSTNISF